MIGGLEDLMIGGLDDWGIGGLEDWMIGGLVLKKTDFKAPALEGFCDFLLYNGKLE
jgi:hypothetical protein